METEQTTFNNAMLLAIEDNNKLLKGIHKQLVMSNCINSAFMCYAISDLGKTDEEKDALLDGCQDLAKDSFETMYTSALNELDLQGDI